MCGNGKALGFRFGLALYGKWVMDLKDRIDQNLMNLFDVKSLPDQGDIRRGDYDTSQYDAHDDSTTTALLPSAADAAALLQRTDDDVDYQDSWRVSKAMARNEHYQQEVLRHVEQSSGIALL